MELIIPVEIKMPQKMSDEAKYFDSQHFLLEMQVRFKFFEKIEDSFLDKVLDEINDLSKYVTKIKKNKDGINVLFNSFNIIEQLIKIYKKKYFIDYKKSKKIMGRDKQKSKDLYRHFLVINILNISKNQNIKIKGKEYRIVNIDRNTLFLRDEFGRKEKFLYSKIKDYIN